MSFAGRILAGAAVIVAPFYVVAEVPRQAFDADVVFLGEVHDNPTHHAVQAEWVAALAPKALVFEMLAPEQAARVTPDLIGDARSLGDLLEWEASGWPDFAMYHPIFAAAPEAAIFGAAVPRAAVLGMMDQDVAASFGPDADRYGLTFDLPLGEQQTRESLQMASHCDALPQDMLPMMVDVQRLRDAVIARVAAEAFALHGGPVVVITGNGHARLDWGAPAALALGDGDLRVFALLQSEAGSMPDGGSDLVLDAPAVDRGDPCDAFR